MLHPSSCKQKSEGKTFENVIVKGKSYASAWVDGVNIQFHRNYLNLFCYCFGWNIFSAQNSNGAGELSIGITSKMYICRWNTRVRNLSFLGFCIFRSFFSSFSGVFYFFREITIRQCGLASTTCFTRAPQPVTLFEGVAAVLSQHEIKFWNGSHSGRLFETKVYVGL
jgi:hypothetical protein